MDSSSRAVRHRRLVGGSLLRPLIPASLALLAAACATTDGEAPASAARASAAPVGQFDFAGWDAYLGGADSSQYSSLSQINKDNVNQLQVAWTYATGDGQPPLFNPTIQYLPQSLGTFQVNNIITAAQVFKAMNCSSTKAQDAVGCLAGHLLATKLNIANGSLVCGNLAQVVADADALLTSINYSGPTGKYTLTTAQRALAISLKTKLDKYNNNISCP